MLNCFIHIICILVAYLYHSENTIKHIKQGLFVKKLYKVKFTKLILINIEKCLYVIFISKGIHTHSSPSPNQVSITIRTHLQELIHQANNDNVNITSTHIVIGK